jgi:hypothetical protein
MQLLRIVVSYNYNYYGLKKRKQKVFRLPKGKNALKSYRFFILLKSNISIAKASIKAIIRDKDIHTVKPKMT